MLVYIKCATNVKSLYIYTLQLFAQIYRKNIIILVKTRIIGNMLKFIYMNKETMF